MCKLLLRGCERLILRLQVHVGTPVAQCRAVNEQRLSASAPVETEAPSSELSGSNPDDPYETGVFDNLIARYEEPNGMARWDAPLFTVPYDDTEPPLSAIWDALVAADGTGRAARPNAATVLPAARPTDALSTLERASQVVVEHVSAWIRNNPGEGGDVELEGTTLVLPPDGVPLPQLQRLRRQFVALYRSQAGELASERMSAVFVTFLNDHWGTSG